MDGVDPAPVPQRHRAMPQDEPVPLRIVVATTTRRRPKMLTRLLASLGEMDRVPGGTVSLLVVENDETPASEAIVQKAAAALRLDVDYVLEPRAGIPMARNRALDEAVARGADVLVFVDDDEWVERDWLTTLIAAYRSGAGALLGGPVRPAAPDRPLSPRQARILTGLQTLGREKEARTLAYHLAGKHNRVILGTGNWLCDLAVIGAHGLRFDEALRVTGGEDTAFFHAARAKGVSTGWVPDAVAHEAMPPERLRLAYLYARARDQSSNALEAKRDRRGWLRAGLSVLNAVTRRLIGMVFSAMRLPVTGVEGQILWARDLGWVVGRIRGLFRQRSAHYRQTTGY